MLRIELPAKIDAMKLWRAALSEHIIILPGPIFSAAGRYKNYLRLNAGIVPSDARNRTWPLWGAFAQNARSTNELLKPRR